MTPEVTNAVNEIRTAFPDSTVVAREDGQGGAYVIVEDVPLGHPYHQPTTWAGFQITFQYPYADIYPHFVRGDLSRVDGRPLGEALTVGAFENRPAVQVSRQSRRRDATVDTAYLKFLRIVEWLKLR